jgi:hypothetical protein
MVEFDVHNLQKIKLAVHITQAAFIVLSWVIEIIVFHKASSIDGRPGWYFGLVSLLEFIYKDAIYEGSKANA